MPPLNPTTLFRAAFVVLAIIFGIVAAGGLDVSTFLGALVGAVFGAGVVLLDIAMKNFTFRRFSHATVGLMVGLLGGLLVNYLIRLVFVLLNEASAEGSPITPEMEIVTQVAIYLAFGYWGAALAMRANRQEFSFIIPYVRFRQDSAQDSPLLVDSNIIIDGRISKICETGFLSGALVVPRFVLDELHLMADSKDSIKRERGKRGLETLNEMQQSALLEVTIQEDYNQTDEPTDTKLIQLAKRLGARLLTNDSNLGKVAQLQGVTVLNLNQLMTAMRPNVLPGDPMQIKLLKEGKDEHQAVGYLDDGTMIVVNNAINHLGETVEVIIGSPLQTSAGRLIFAELQK